MRDTDRGPGSSRPALLVRLFLYALFAALAFEAVVRGAAAIPVEVFAKEGGPLEIAQHVLGGASAALFFAAAYRSDAFRRLTVLAGICCLLAVVREADHFLDHALGKGSYTYFTWPLGIAAIGVAAVSRERLAGEFAAFVRTPAFFLGATAVFVILVYGQIVGQKQLWQAVMGDGYQRGVKDTVEEVQELLGYLLLWFSSIEAFVASAGGAKTGGEDGS